MDKGWDVLSLMTPCVKIKILNWVIIQLNLTTSDSIPKESVPAGVGAVTTAPGTYGFAALFLLSGAMELAVWTQATLCAVVGWVGNTFLSPAKTGSVGLGFDSSLENMETWTAFRVPTTSCHPELLPSLLWTAMLEQPHVGALLRRHES